MRFYKTVSDGYLVSIGIGSGGEEIKETEYTEILAVIRNKPAAREGFDYRLKTDLTWELDELSTVEPDPLTGIEEIATETDYENALRMVGVDV